MPQKITDQQLRVAFEKGMAPADIARQYGVSEAALSQRLKKLRQGTLVATSFTPAETVVQYTQGQIQILLELTQALQRINKLGDAYDRWLTDPDNPDWYDIGPRSNEISVIHMEQVGEKSVRKKESLRVLLARLDAGDVDVVSAESKHADPRVELRNSMAEVRKFMELALELDDRLRQQKQMEILQQGILQVLREASPEIAAQVARKLRALFVVTGEGG